MATSVQAPRPSEILLGVVHVLLWGGVVTCGCSRGVSWLKVCR